MDLPARGGLAILRIVQMSGSKSEQSEDVVVAAKEVLRRTK